MTKTEQWEKIQEILLSNKASKKLTSALEELLKPKNGGTSMFPPKLDKDGNITELYCQWHKKYEPVDNFKTSTKSKTGYHYECKDAEKEWNLYAKEIKAQESELTKLVDKILDGEIEQVKAKELSDDIKTQIAALKEARKNKVNFENFVK